MAHLKKICPDSKLDFFTYDDDPTKEWFVWYRAIDGSRCKIYKGINRKGMTIEQRYIAAKNLIEEVRKKFPYVPKADLVIYLHQYVDSKNLRKKSRQSYKSHIKALEDWYKGGRFRNKDAIDFLEHLKEKGNGDSTRHKYRQFFISAFSWMEKKNLWPENPFIDTDPIKARHTPYRYFQKPQMRELKRVISHRDPELWLFVQFIYYCFIRPGELRMMKVSDIIWDEKKLLLRSGISKNWKQQYVRIPDAFYPQVEEMWIDRSPGAFLFQRAGERSPLPINEMSNRHRKILRELDYGKGFALYSWKHTGAVSFVRAGGNLKSLQLQLRHHSLDQVDAYIRDLGVGDMPDINTFPEI